MDGRGTCPALNSPLSHTLPRVGAPAPTDPSDPDTPAECWAVWVGAEDVVRSQHGQGGAVNQDSCKVAASQPWGYLAADALWDVKPWEHNASPLVPVFQA